jgi:integrase
MSRSRNGVYKRQHSNNYFFRVKNADGAWIERSSGTSDYNLAKKQKGKMQREIEDGCLPNDRSSWTLKVARQEWLNDRKLRVAPGTYASDVTNTRNLMSKLGEDTKLIRLADMQAIKRYQTLRLKDRVTTKKIPTKTINTKTINNEVLALLAILEDANLRHRVSSGYRPLKVRRSELGVALTREQELKLVAVAQNSEPSAVAPYVAVLSDRTGLRMKEIKHLRLDDIHLTVENPYVHVRRCTTKTDAGNRYVALDQVACWALRQLMARACSLGATEPADYLLPTLLDAHTRKNDPLSGRCGYDATHPMSSWDKEWGRLRKIAGLGTARFHDLRHTYITRAAEAGVAISVIQEQVGHVSKEMVKRYTHISQGAIHQAVGQIEQNSPELLRQLGLEPAKPWGGVI